MANGQTRKRKRAAETAPDDRFKLTEEFDDDARAASEGSDDEPATELLEDQAADTPKTSLPAHLLPSRKRKTTPGLVYLSRIPPGMGPSKVKHLLSAYGQVGRVFLARDKAFAPKKQKRGKEKHLEHRFKEGWIEFEDKKVARSVAEMLNANPIGGKKNSRWRDDVWTMKYLPRFRWENLSEQVALERATQDSLLRFHLQNSKREQESYLAAVEQARVGKAIEAKAEARAASKGKQSAPAKPKGPGRQYKQREAVGHKESANDKTLDSVLGRLF